VLGGPDTLASIGSGTLAARRLFAGWVQRDTHTFGKSGFEQLPRGSGQEGLASNCEQLKATWKMQKQTDPDPVQKSTPLLITALLPKVIGGLSTKWVIPILFSSRKRVVAIPLCVLALWRDGWTRTGERVARSTPPPLSQGRRPAFLVHRRRAGVPQRRGLTSESDRWGQHR